MIKCVGIFILLFVLSSCEGKKDDLTIVKQFNKEDKYFKASLKSLHFVIETHAVEDVDSVFSTSIRSNGLPVDATGCADGIYTGASPLDAYDYCHVVKITIKDQKIIEVDYDEVNLNGKGKQFDSLYCKEMSVSGTTPFIAYPKYEAGLLLKQNLLSVDAVSGATYSLYRFRYAATLALMKARLAKVI